MMLPKECVCSILSLATPQDACRFSLVSSVLRSAAESDFLWERFLPDEYQDILRRATHPLRFGSKKELYLCLCNPILIDGGTKSFQLEKSSGKVSYMLSARELSIEWSNDPMYWCWKPVPDSRFAEVAELITTSWLEIHGKIKTQALSKKTVYGAYLVLQVCARAYGLDSIPSEVSVQVGGNQVCAGTTYLCCEDSKKQQMERLMYGNRRTARLGSDCDGDGVTRRPHQREDGWLEIELGEFFNSGGGDDEVKMSLMEVKGYQLKGGLVVQGIEVRPKNLF